MLALCAKPAALFVWGRGRDGQLGHGDYEDRDEPERLVFFDERKLAPRIIAAGDAHSLVVVDAARFGVRVFDTPPPRLERVCSRRHKAPRLPKASTRGAAARTAG